MNDFTTTELKLIHNSLTERFEKLIHIERADKELRIYKCDRQLTST